MKGEQPPDDDAPDLQQLEHDPEIAQTPARCARALGEQDYRGFDAFYSKDADGEPLLTRDEIARVQALMARIRVEQDIAVWPYKDTDPAHFPTIKAFNRTRPFVKYGDAPHGLLPCTGLDAVPDPAHLSPEEKVKIQARLGSSFPSGHAAVAQLQARALGLVFPDRKDRFLARARQLGLDRQILRVHYPSDVASGVRVGDRLFEALRASPRFMRDAAAIRSCSGKS
jgi:hypothetical protein